jgi:hypothetical protein
MQLRINHSNDMNTPTSTPKEITMPSLFQIAAYFEDFFPAGGRQRPVAQLRQSPLADLMLQPEKLRALLATSQARGSAGR